MDEIVLATVLATDTVDLGEHRDVTYAAVGGKLLKRASLVQKQAPLYTLITKALFFSTYHVLMVSRL